MNTFIRSWRNFF